MLVHCLALIVEHKHTTYAFVFRSTGEPDVLHGVAETMEERILGMLRQARQTRLLVCTELLIPPKLVKQIVINVISMAEYEPCGLRGCLVNIYLEGKKSTSIKNVNKSSTDVALVSTQMLGQFLIDPSVVPTHEIYVTFKRTPLDWLDILEDKLLRKERIILSEIYLITKKRLYCYSPPN